MNEQRPSKPLVQRLREDSTWPNALHLCREAANEIENLQERVNDLLAQLAEKIIGDGSDAPQFHTNEEGDIDFGPIAPDEPPPALCVDPAFEGTRCPFTKLPYFMHLEHPELGRVPTYGGPYDSYTIPVPDDDDERTLRSERYDHDEGAWIEGGEPWPMNLVTNEEFVDLHALREERASEPPGNARYCPFNHKPCEPIDLAEETSETKETSHG